ncbi:MAG TPA: hypothetical protein VFG73_01415 [Rhodanobacteraceae bacterium]|nr:hypothetical protein [Rhodanobacteraceae bacterium]
MTLRTFLLGAAVVVAFGCVWAVLHNAPAAESARNDVRQAPVVPAAARPSSISTVAATRQPANGTVKLAVPQSHVTLVPVSPGSAAAVRAELVQAYACPTCDLDDPFAARSAAEAAWMSSRGFPTQEQLQNIAGLDPVALRTLSGNGNLVATSLLGTALLRKGDVSQALQYLAKAREEGSVYAQYGWAEWLDSERTQTPTDTWQPPIFGWLT